MNPKKFEAYALTKKLLQDKGDGPQFPWSCKFQSYFFISRKYFWKVLNLQQSHSAVFYLHNWFSTIESILNSVIRWPDCIILLFFWLRHFMTIMDQYFELNQSDCIWQQQKKKCFLGFCDLIMAGPTPKKNIFVDFLQSTSTNNQLTKCIQMYSFEVFQRFMVMPVILFENSKYFFSSYSLFWCFLSLFYAYNFVMGLA